MSDGNFNRNLLPYNNYQSGLRAGISRTKIKFLETFKRWLGKEYPDLSEVEIKNKLEEFHKLLNEK